MTIAVITGTRPEIIKLYPVMKILDLKGIDYKFIHTGQHYDYNLSLKFIKEFGLRTPDYAISLNGCQTSAEQISIVLRELSIIFRKVTPSQAMVEGDTNSVLAAALASVKHNIPLIHLEAGLRSYDWKMPEEINRKVVDDISDLLLAPTAESSKNLHLESAHGEIHVVGNTVIDAVRLTMNRMGWINNNDNGNYKLISVKFKEIIESFELGTDFILVTLHRSDTVDDPNFLREVLSALSYSGLNFIFPMHPRTRSKIHEFGLGGLISISIKVVPPLGYFDFLLLLKMCKFVITDSGGVQEEICSPLINKHALVIRGSTERPESVQSGHTILCKSFSQQKILEAIEKVQRLKAPKPNACPYGSGYAAEKIIEVVKKKFYCSSPRRVVFPTTASETLTRDDRNSSCGE